MPISGLVVTFDAPVAQCDAALEVLTGIDEVEIGQAQGNKLAIAVDTLSKSRDREIWELVQGLPCVSDVSIALVAFDEDKGETP